MTPEKPAGKEPGDPILIVDDEEIVLVALRDTLMSEGYRVVASPHAIHALSVLKEQQFSVVISDQQMPMVSGLEFLAQVREIQPDATRILITAVLSLSTVIDAINKGEVYRFIVKPWAREELLATVKGAVQRHEATSKNARLHAIAQAANRQLQESNHALEANLRRSVEMCVQTMRTFYPVLGNQVRQAAALCEVMAGEAGLSATEKQALEISGWIYDMGLVGLPRQLIERWQRSPGELSEAEWALIQQHPILGQELADFVHQLAAVGTTIRGHHERYDGTGYPDHLRGDKIPWLARLLGVAVASAESNLHPTRAAEAINRGKGTAFDPEAVKVFLRAAPKMVAPGKPRAVHLAELRPGMVLAEGIYSEQGVLLVADGERLTASNIVKLANYNRVNPILQQLLVYC
jgi:response regulator RpfG family c-di-GMP phosphodiesterase